MSCSLSVHVCGFVSRVFKSLALSVCMCVFFSLWVCVCVFLSLWVRMCVFLSLESLAQTEDIIARKFKVSNFLCAFLHVLPLGCLWCVCACVRAGVCVCVYVCVCVCVSVRWGSGWWWSPYMTRPWIRGGSDQTNVFNWACSSKNSSRKVLTDPHERRTRTHTN